MDELFVDKILDGDFFDPVIESTGGVELFQPPFPQIRIFLVKGHVESLDVCFLFAAKGDLMVRQVAEVLFGLFGSGGSQTFVVFD